MSDRLKGKVAIITGCNSGIGFATVKLFLQEGAKVVGTDIRVDNALKFAEEHPDDYTVLRADATEEADWEKACQTAVEKYGKLTTICNIAGIVKGIELPDVTKESFLKMQEVNAYSNSAGHADRLQVPGKGRWLFDCQHRFHGIGAWRSLLLVP